MPTLRNPRFARERFREAKLAGVVSSIQVRPERAQPVTAVESWDLSSTADHGRSEKRAVTLFQYEHLAVIVALLGRPVTFEQTRRNLCVRGFNLEAARGEELLVGETVLLVTGRCHPCIRMEASMGPGGFSAMFGYGGWTASIVRAGVVQTGDPVRLG